MFLINMSNRLINTSSCAGKWAINNISDFLQDFKDGEWHFMEVCVICLSLHHRYVPWNLHEEIRGTFKFDGNLDIG